MDPAQPPVELQNIGQNVQQNVHTANTLPVIPIHGSHAAPHEVKGATRLDNHSTRSSWHLQWSKIRKWWLEFAGAFSSIVLLTAIVIFLAEIDGSKLDDWRFPWQIKPPTVLFILVTVCRINLAFFVAEGIGQLKWVFFEQREHQLSDFDSFDEATRGPWGAITFIWKINRRAFVAAFGALMAILILAMDPFSQQVIYYATRASNVTESIATVPSASFYDSGALVAALSMNNQTAVFDSDYVQSTVGADSGPMAFGSFAAPYPTGDVPTTTGFLNSSASSDRRTKRNDGSTDWSEQGASSCSDTLMARAAYAGVFTSISSPEFTCSTGNCTWPAFTTLGICSECQDVMQKATRTCNSGNPKLAGYQACWYQSTGAEELPGTMQYPGDDAGPFLPGYVDAKSTPFRRYCASSGFTQWPLWFTWLPMVWDKNRDLLSFTSYRFPLQRSSDDQDCSVPVARIEQCNLFWCAKTFDSALAVNGNFTEGPSKDIRLVPFDTNTTRCPGIRTLRPPERDSKTPMQGYIREDRACPQSREEIGVNDTFWVNTNDHVMTVNMLVPMVRSQEMTIDRSGSTCSSKGAEAAIMTALWDNHQGNLSLTLADIAAAMTNHVRSTSGSIVILDITTREETVVKVIWYWLIYMVAMVGLSLALFVVAVIFASEKSKVVWKSSSLAVLMHGLSGFDRSQLEHETLHDMGNAAKDLWAQLKNDAYGSLKLVKQ